MNLQRVFFPPPPFKNFFVEHVARILIYVVHLHFAACSSRVAHQFNASRRNVKRPFNLPFLRILFLLIPILSSDGLAAYDSTDGLEGRRV